MIGEKIKIGFDGSAVKRGLSGIMGGFNKLGRGIGRVSRQVGIGAARQMGASLFGTLMRTVTSIPREIKALSDLRQEFFALNDATGASVDTMLALRQAIAKTSNVSPQIASNTLKEMTAKIGESLTYGSAAFKALEMMNIKPEQIKGKNVVDQLDLIAKGYRRLRNGAEGLEVANDVIKDLLGARVGKDVTPLLLNFNEAMAKAAKDTEAMAKGMNKSSKELDAIDDIQISFSNKMSELALGTIEVLNASGITAEYISKKINDIEVSKNLSGVSEWIKTQLAQMKDEGLFGWIYMKLKELGSFLSKWLSDAISKGIKDGIGAFLPSMPKWLGFKNRPKVKLDEATDWLSDGMGKIMKAIVPEMKTNTKITPPVDPKSTYEIFKPTEFKTFENGKEIEKNTSQTNVLLQGIKDNMGVATYV